MSITSPSASIRGVGLVRRHVRLARAAQQRADPRAELADRERLRDVVVRAELEPEHLVELVVARGEHDDRHRARRPQPLADLEPVEPRQHQVEHDQVDRLLGEPPQRLLAVASLDNNVPVFLERERRGRCARRPRRRPAGSWGSGRASAFRRCQDSPGDGARTLAAPGADRSNVRSTAASTAARSLVVALAVLLARVLDRAAGRRCRRRSCRRTSTAPAARVARDRTSPATTPTARPEAPARCSRPRGSATRCGSTTCRSRRTRGRRRSRAAAGRSCRTSGRSRADSRARRSS